MHISCSFLHNAIYKGQVCYDEDVSAFTFGISLENEVSKDILLDAIQTIDRAIQSCDLKTRQDPVSGHLEARLLFLRQVLKIWMKLMNPNEISDLKEAVAACKNAKECLELFVEGKTDDTVLEEAVGFVPTLHEAAIGCAPKKKLNVIPFSKVIEQWENILTSIIEACGWMMKARTWKDVRAGLDSFAAMDNDPFVRSLIYKIIVSTDGDAPWKPSISMLSKDMHLWDSNSSFFAALTKLPELQHFFDQCMIAVQGWCHTKCLNRNRQRRNLRHNVADWKNMCDHAYTAETTAEVRRWLESLGFQYNPSIDSGIQPDDRLAPMTCWVVQEACWTCIDHLLLGGPLDLYQVEENISIYWYASFLMDNIDFMARELDNISMSRQLMMASAQSTRQQKNAKLAAPGCDLANFQVPPAKQGPLKEAWLQRKFRVLNCMVLSATANVFCALKHCGIIEPPHHAYNGYKENHEQRFGFMRQLHIPEFLEHSSILEQEAKFLDIPMNQNDQIDCIEPDARKGKQAILQSFESINTCFIVAKDLKDSMVATSPHASHQVAHLESLSKVILANTTALRLIMTLMNDKSRDLKSQYMVQFHFVDEKTSASRAGIPVLCFPVVSIKKR